jgi:hypothetical protein
MRILPRPNNQLEQSSLSQNPTTHLFKAIDHQLHLLHDPLHLCGNSLHDRQCLLYSRRHSKLGFCRVEVRGDTYVFIGFSFEDGDEADLSVERFVSGSVVCSSDGIGVRWDLSDETHGFGSVSFALNFLLTGRNQPLSAYLSEVMRHTSLCTPGSAWF